jgi:hypothetical protein
MSFGELEFGSLLAYCPKGVGPPCDEAREWMLRLKTGRLASDPPQRVPEQVAEYLRANLSTPPLSTIRTKGATLVPVLSSSLRRKGSLWVPEQLALAFVKAGLGDRMAPLLERTRPLRKAATSRAKDRPLAQEHYDSTAVHKDLSTPSAIVLVDDVVPRGSTLVGMARRVEEAFPGLSVRAFAAMRTVSNAEEFRGLVDPQCGRILRRSNGPTRHRP